MRSYSVSFILLIAFVLCSACRSDAKHADLAVPHPNVENASVPNTESVPEVSTPELTKDTPAHQTLNTDREVKEPVTESKEPKTISQEKYIEQIENLSMPVGKDNSSNQKEIRKEQDSKKEEAVVAQPPLQENQENSEKDTEQLETPVKADKTVPSPDKDVSLQPEVKKPAPVAGIHDTWNELLSKYVSRAGTVDYKGFKKETSNLNTYLESLGNQVPAKGSTSKETMAFWMNAYNAFTVKLILQNYPIKSIRDIHGGNPWDVKWIDLGGSKYSLNQIEHEILRPTFKDARIHFAVNCAAQSCPKLHNEAFTADKLENQLEQLTRSFVSNTKANGIGKRRLELSKIFEWYAEDFGDIRQFISRYTDSDVSPSAAISYREYDWSLNGK